MSNQFVEHVTMYNYSQMQTRTNAFINMSFLDIAYRYRYKQKLKTEDIST